MLGRFLAGSLLIALLLAVLGCGSKPKVPIVQVSGKLVNADKEVPGVLITFWPEEGLPNSFPSVSMADGTFSLACPKGRYSVTLQAPGATVPTPDAPPCTVKIPEHYQRREDSPLKVELLKDKNDDVTLVIGEKIR